MSAALELTIFRLWDHSATECFIDAMWLERYLVQRGGVSKPTDIAAPKIEWPDNPMELLGPIREALRVKKAILEDLERLTSLACKVGDNSLQDVIKTRFLRKETKHVKDLADLLLQTSRVSKASWHGIYQLDKELRIHDGCVPWGDVNDPDTVGHRVEEVVSCLHGDL